MAKYKEPSVLYSDYENIAYPPHMNYGRFILDNLLKYEEKIALIDGETHEKITYNEMAQLIVNTATALKQMGIKESDVIGICSENRTEFLITAIACWAIGAVVTFINSAYSKDELVHTTKISKPAIVCLSSKTFKTFYTTFKSLSFVKKVIVFGNEITEPSVIKFEKLTSVKVDIYSFKTNSFDGSGQTALILYSSGTTGLPKGVKLSHQNLIISGLQPFFLKNGVCISIAPWSNTVGIILTMDELTYGETIVYLTRFNEDVYLKCIEKYKVRYLLAVPPLIVLLNQSKKVKNYDVRSIEIIYCGGAPIDEGTIEDAKKTFPNLCHFLQGYGMTETSGALLDDTPDAPRQGSVGKIVLGNIIKIVDVETRKLLGPNQPGEVCVKGPVLFQGYIDKDLKDDLDEEGFYKTGDIAYYDEDGYFYIVDRLKELIKYKAGQVAPSELEAVLRNHPAIKDVGVVGVPDRLAGELPLAFVVKSPGIEVTEKEIKDFVAAKVSSWKQLRGGVKFVQEIPKTPSGKILRRKLRELLNPTSKL